MKGLKHVIAQSFKKIRLTNTCKEKPCKELSILFKERENIKQNIQDERKHSSDDLQLKLEIVEEKIADFLAEKNFRIIKEHVEYLIDDIDNLNCLKM